MATAKRIRTDETNFPLRAHPQEWRQRKFTIIVPLNIAASASTGLGVASFVASVPFDVGSVTMEVPVIDVPAAYTTTGVQAASTIAQSSYTVTQATSSVGTATDTATEAKYTIPTVTYTSGASNITVNSTGTMSTAPYDVPSHTTSIAAAARTVTNGDQSVPAVSSTVTNGNVVTTVPGAVSNQGVVGLREWAGIFGVAQAIMHAQGASVSITHDFPRPVPIQGAKFTVDCYRTANADDSIGLWKDGSWGAADLYGALRLTFHRVD